MNEYLGSKKDTEGSPGMLFKLFEHIYAPFLLKKWIRAAVVIIFFGWACSSIAVVPKIEIGLWSTVIIIIIIVHNNININITIIIIIIVIVIVMIMIIFILGLDQEISMPDNSFVLKYFTFLKVSIHLQEFLSLVPIHAFMQTCRHADMQTCRHAFMQTCIHADMHSCRLQTCIDCIVYSCIYALIDLIYIPGIPVCRSSCILRG